MFVRQERFPAFSNGMLWNKDIGFGYKAKEIKF